MLKVAGRVSLLGFCAATAACRVLDGPNCTDEARAAIVVWIQDSVTGEFAGAGARAIASERDYADTAFAEETMFPYPLAFERPGTYALVVEKPGYQTWRT